MLPSYAGSGSKVTPRHNAAAAASFSNGYPRSSNTLEFSPHRYDGDGPTVFPSCRGDAPSTLCSRANLLLPLPFRFQPRNSPPSLRRRRKLLVRLAIVAALVLFGVFVWPAAPVLSLFSLSLFSSGDHIQLETVRYYDLSNVQGTARGWEREERILLCVPLRDAEPHLPMFFSHLRNFTYPHHLIDLAFLVSDSKDHTLEMLVKNLESIQADTDSTEHFGEISILEKDFGQKVNQDVESRHGFAAQANRRKLMAQARNWLLSASLRPYHSWVYWRDVDVETAPFTILEDLMRHNKDVIVPSMYCAHLSFSFVVFNRLTISRRLAPSSRLAGRRATVRFELVAGVRDRPSPSRYPGRGRRHC